MTEAEIVAELMRMYMELTQPEQISLF